MAIKYIVKLTEYERETLMRLTGRDLRSQRTRYAHILLALDRSHGRRIDTYEQIGQQYGVDKSTVTLIAKRYVSGGVIAALMRKEQDNRYRKVDDALQTHIVALAHSRPPEGCERWTLQRLAEELVRLGVVENLSVTAVSDTLKRANVSLNRRPRLSQAERVQNL